jgi:hypothetical protein
MNDRTNVRPVQKRVPWSRLLAAVGVATLLPLWLGCAPRPQGSGPAPSAQSPSQPATLVRPRSTAALAFLSPTPGAVITGPTVHVRLKLTGAVIVPQTSMHLTPNTGHIHLSLDGRVISMTYGVEQDVQVGPGTHLLQAEFVATDHFPFNPRVTTLVTFTDQ